MGLYRIIQPPLTSSAVTPAVNLIMSDFGSDGKPLACFIVSGFVLGFGFGPVLQKFLQCDVPWVHNWRYSNPESAYYDHLSIPIGLLWCHTNECRRWKFLRPGFLAASGKHYSPFSLQEFSWARYWLQWSANFWSGQLVIDGRWVFWLVCNLLLPLSLCRSSQGGIRMIWNCQINP